MNTAQKMKKYENPGRSFRNAMAGVLVCGLAGCTATANKVPLIQAGKADAPFVARNKDKKMRTGEFWQEVRLLRQELDRVEAQLDNLRIGRASVGLSEHVGRLRRLEKDFGASCAHALAKAASAATAIENRDADAAELAVAELSGAVEALVGREKKAQNEKTLSLLDKLKAYQNKPRFLKAVYASRIRNTANEIDSALSRSDLLENEQEKPQSGDGSLEKAISEAQTSVSVLRKQLGSLKNTALDAQMTAAKKLMKALGQAESEGGRALDRKMGIVSNLKECFRQIDEIERKFGAE